LQFGHRNPFVEMKGLLEVLRDAVEVLER